MFVFIGSVRLFKKNPANITPNNKKINCPQPQAVYLVKAYSLFFNGSLPDVAAASTDDDQ
jgi:hypothetical protein